MNESVDFKEATMKVGVIAFALMAAACGGGPSGPSPLRYTLDDMLIAAVALDHKQAVIQAKQDYDVAQMERAKVQTDLADVDTKLEIAGNEAGQMELAEKSAKSEKRAAEKGADLARRNNAERDLHNAQLGKRAADAKVDFLKAKKGWMKSLLRYTDFNVYAREAKYQLEKARVAKANNIRPAGFDVQSYENQYQDRSEAAQRQKLNAENAKKRAEEKRQEWNGREKEYMAAKGLPLAGQATAAGLGGTSANTPPPTITSTNNNEPLK